MSRILEALKQIEARQPAGKEAEPPSPADSVPCSSSRPLLDLPQGPPAAAPSAQRPPPDEIRLDEAPADEPLPGQTTAVQATAEQAPQEQAPEGHLPEEHPPEEPIPEEVAPEEYPPLETSPADAAPDPVAVTEPSAEVGEPAPPRQSRQAQTEVTEAPQPETPPPQAGPSLEDEIRDLPEGPVEGQEAGFRELAANLLAGLPPGRPAVLLFTSPGDGEGKTTTLAPLAALLAERISGGILAVDCNLGRPQLAGQFGVAARRGLRAVLRGAAHWQEAVRSTALEGLCVLPALQPGPGEDPALDVSALAGLLEELRGHFRLVLVDAASLAHPELASLVRVCDGTYLVVRLGQTTSGQATAAAGVIGENGGRLLGCIVTGAVPSIGTSV